MRNIIISAAIIISVNASAFASYKEALTLYEAKMYNDSLNMIAAELDISKDMDDNSPNYDLRYLAAHNHWKMGNIGSAITHFKRCTEIKKDNPDPMIDLSLLMLDFKRYSDARYFAGKALSIKDSAIPYYVIGQCSLIAGRYNNAKQNFEKAISINPEFGASYNALGMALMRLGKFSEANTAFSAALVFLPDSPEILNNMGMSLEKTGKDDKALEYFTKASEKSPDDSIIQKNLARLKGRMAN